MELMNDIVVNDRLATVYDTLDRPMTYKEAYDILCDPDESKYSILPPMRPLHGQMFLFSSDNTANHNADGYLWCTSTGFNKIPKKEPLIQRKRKNIRTAEKSEYGDNRFSMFIHKLSIEPSPILTHYVGDEKLFIPRPHGNEKKKMEKDFFSSASSLRSKIKVTASTDVPARSVYEDMRSKQDALLHPAFSPRDLKQVQNLQQNLSRASDQSEESLDVFGKYLISEMRTLPKRTQERLKLQLLTAVMNEKQASDF